MDAVTLSSLQLGSPNAASDGGVQLPSSPMLAWTGAHSPVGTAAETAASASTMHELAEVPRTLPSLDTHVCTASYCCSGFGLLYLFIIVSTV